MREQIEKILVSEIGTFDELGDAVKVLEILFLEKQIELFDEIDDEHHPYIKAEIRERLQFQLNELKP